MESILGLGEIADTNTATAADADLSVEQAVSWFTTPAFGLTIALIAIGVFFWLLLRWLKKRYINKHLTKGQASTLVRVVVDLIRALITVLVILGILQANGVNVSSALAGIGIAGVIVGLALQDYLKDYIMGIHILTDHFFEVGDVIDYNGQVGKVIEFNLKTTRLENIMDGSVITICNRNISEVTRRGNWYDLDIPLSYDANVKMVHETMREICRKIADDMAIINCEYKGTQDFADSAIMYKIRFYCQPEHYPEARRICLRYVQERLNEKGLEIPYNQMDVHLRGGNIPH